MQEENVRFQVTSELVRSMVSLLNLPASAKVLVIEFGNQVASLATQEGYEIIHIQSNENIDGQINKIKANGPYDGAIILPAFSAIQASLSFAEPPKGWVDLRHPVTEDWLIATATNSLKPDGALTALVPNGLLSNFGRQAMRKGLLQRGLTLVAKIPPDLLFRDYRQVQVSTALILLNRNRTDSSRFITFVDWINYADLPEKETWQEIIAGALSLEDAIVRVHFSDLKEAYRLDPQYYDPAYLLIKPPQGYVEFSLDEIADIRGGFMCPKEDRSETKNTEKSLPYLQVRHILYTGELAAKVFWIEPSKVPDFEARLAKLGDILITVSGTVGKVAIVPEMYSEGVFFDTSIRRVRVNHDYAKPDWVFQFLQSELGQLQFRRLTSGTAQPQITSPDLESMRVFLPAPHEGTAGKEIKEPKTTDITGNQALPNLFADAIQENVVEYLRNVKPNDTEWKEIIEKTLRSAIEGLIPKPLGKVILEDFPAPIAIPYRRFNMARYNSYERLDRMVSLVESCVYFVFHVLLVDFCTHGWQSQITLSKESKQALKGMQSIDYRLKFIKEVFEAAQSGSVTLFMPELVNTDIVEVGDKLRDEVRNPISHSAPGSEPYVRSLIDKYLPSVNKLLESLRFLADYTLCRIRTYYYQNGSWRYQAEIYRGAEYDVNIEESRVTEDSAEGKLIQADCDHLVILSPDDETLDIHPFYQLYFGDETARESHLCFYKHRQGKRLVGESIRSSVEVTLQGTEDFQVLTGVNIGGTGQDV